MTNAHRDANRVPTLIAVDNSDSTQEVAVTADPATGRLLTQSLNVGLLVPYNYDYIAYTNTNSTTDTYVYKTGGSGGTTVATLTIVFTDATKTQPSTVTRT